MFFSVRNNLRWCNQLSLFTCKVSQIIGILIGRLISCSFDIEKIVLGIFIETLTSPCLLYHNDIEALTLQLLWKYGLTISERECTKVIVTLDDCKVRLLVGHLSIPH